jgi:hypothetical protein
VTEAHDIGDVLSSRRTGVAPSRVDSVIAQVARERKLDPGLVRNTKLRRRKVAMARREAWRRLALPNVSIMSIAAAWPCHHTAILHALGRVNKKRKRWEECATVS